jgi:hypothetical protein
MLRLARTGFALLILGSALLIGTVAMAAAPTNDSADRSTIDACADMMGGSSPEEGRKAMQEFMKSDRAPQAMTNMMDMARGMGNGDPMLGMTRMMEMMGGMGGMTGDSGAGTARPEGDDNENR